MNTPNEDNFPTEPEQTRSIERKAQVLNAAIKLMADFGAAGITHRKVAQESDSSPGVVRYYFRTREDLLIACLEYFEDERLRIATAILKELDSEQLTIQELANLALKIYYGPDLDDATVTSAVWTSVDCVRESQRLAQLLGKQRLAAQDQVGQLLTQCGYQNIDPSFVGAVLDGRILASTFERTAHAALAAETELAQLLQLINRASPKSH